MSTAPAARTTTTADDREHRTLVAARAQPPGPALATRDLVLSIATPILLLVLWEVRPRRGHRPALLPAAHPIVSAGGEMLMTASCGSTPRPP